VNDSGHNDKQLAERNETVNGLIRFYFTEKGASGSLLSWALFPIKRQTSLSHAENT
jgi:hypothetical protein